MLCLNVLRISTQCWTTTQRFQSQSHHVSSKPHGCLKIWSLSLKVYSSNNPEIGVNQQPCCLSLVRKFDAARTKLYGTVAPTGWGTTKQNWNWASLTSSVSYFGQKKKKLALLKKKSKENNSYLSSSLNTDSIIREILFYFGQHQSGSVENIFRRGHLVSCHFNLFFAHQFLHLCLCFAPQIKEWQSWWRSPLACCDQEVTSILLGSIRSAGHICAEDLLNQTKGLKGFWPELK